jgi:hypothetical protein
MESMWRLCNIRVQTRKLPTANGYWRLLQKEWRDIPQHTIKSLVDSMPVRLQAVVDAQGGNTTY